jgi:hypothetical protein
MIGIGVAGESPAIPSHITGRAGPHPAVFALLSVRPFEGIALYYGLG